MFDAFLKINGIAGESTDDAHKDWIEILGYSWGVSQPMGGASGHGGGRSTGRADFQDLRVTKCIDKSSPQLYQSCANGRHITRVEMELCQANEGKHNFMKYVLEDVFVSAVQTVNQTTQSGDRPVEEVSLNYGRISWFSTPLDPNGAPGPTVQATWDLKTNKASVAT